MQVGGASAKRVTRAEEPSSAGQGVAPVSDPPIGAATGAVPEAGRFGGAEVAGADVVVLLEAVAAFVPERLPMTAPTMLRTTTATIATAMIRWRLRTEA